MTIVPELRDELRDAAQRHLLIDAAPVAPRRRNRPRWPVLGAVLLVFGAGAGAAAARLGVFEPAPYAPGAPKTTAADFSPELRSEFPALQADPLPAAETVSELLPNDPRFDTSLARPIATVTGPGYAFPAVDGGVCLAVPDPDSSPGGWGLGCSSGDHIAKAGVRLAFVDEAGAGTATALVPAGAAAEVRSDGASRAVDVSAGVASVELAAGQRLTISPSKTSDNSAESR